MKKIFYLIILTNLILISCDTKEDKKLSLKYSSSQIRQVVLDALKGNEDKNNLLSGLADLSLPVNLDYNKLQIDSFVIDNKIFYPVLLEFPNPAYNRFAVYDENLKCFIIDKSINGFTKIKFYKTASFNFISLTENFLTKDTIEVQRLSLFKMADDSINLSFRTFTKVIFLKEDLTQEINSITNNYITTVIRQSRIDDNNFIADTFFYNENHNAFTSSDSRFDELVKDKIKLFRLTPKKKFLNSSDDIDKLRAESFTSSSDDIISESKGYSINLDSTWQEIQNFSITQNLKKEIRGVRYVNNRLGTTISIARISASDSAESYITQPLPNKTSGEYRIRFSNAFEQSKSILLFIEHSCKDKKFIIIVEAPKFTYPQNKHIYEDILNSFFIEC